MENVLIKDSKYNGSYVAIKDFSDSRVIANGKDPKEVHDSALKQGCSNPVILFIPTKNMVQIY